MCALFGRGEKRKSDAIAGCEMRTILQTIIAKNLFTGTRLSFCTLPLERGAYMGRGIGRFSMIPHCPREMKRHLCVFIIDRTAIMPNLLSMQID
jgi:hypothetical protein